jgi:topoisomerase-4 subunit A
MIELANEHDIVALSVFKGGRKFLVASDAGRGFIVPEAEVLGTTRKGKQVMGVTAPEEMRIAVPAAGDTVAILGENRKLLIFPLKEVPEMNRGRGVMLQKYKDGGLSDARVYAKADGLTWRLGEKTRTETDLKLWIGERAQAGRLPPNGFPKGNKFG